MAGHLAGVTLLPTWPAGSVSLAFWATSLFCVMGLGLTATAAWPGNLQVRRVVIVIALAALAAGLATVIATIAGMPFDIERLAPFRSFSRLPPSSGRSTGPLGAPVIVFASLALLLQVTNRGRAFVGAIASLPLLAGMLVCVGLVYQSPVLRVSGWRPVSLVAALAAILYSVGVIALAGPAVWPLRAMAGPSVRAQLLRWFMPFTVLTVLGTDVLTVSLFSSYSPALASVLNALISMAGAAAVTYFVSRRIGGRLDHAERETIRVNRLYSVLSSTNALITRVREPNALFGEACRIAVESGGFDMAWVGEVDRDTRQIRPVAAEGNAATYLDGIRISADDIPEGRGPTGRAVRERRAVVCADLAKHPEMEPWKEKARHEGFRASAAFPLTTLGEVTNVLSIYACDTGWFTGEQVALLERLASDLSYALGTIAREQQRARLQDQLRQAQKMETIGQLAGGIAHDFNNMLSIVMANTELVSATLPPELVEAASELRDVRDAAERGKALVRQLMTFSRVGKLEREAIDLGALALRVARMLQRMLPETVSIECTVEPGLKPAWADPGAVEQMVLNLSTNSRDAMPDGGRLIITVGRADAADVARQSPVAPMAGDILCLVVTDTGTGMDAATLQRVFDPFFTTKPAGKGTGLGLAMVHGIMGQHGGSVHITSEVGRGTSARLYFPVAAAASADRVRTDANPGAQALRGTETVLVVEDEEALRRAVQRVLERYGYKVLTAEDGEIALEMLRRNETGIDLILTDLIMPNMGGVELYHRVTNDLGPRRFLIASGYNPGETMGSAGPPAGVPFIRKPWTLVEVLEAVRKALEAEPR